MKTPKGMRQQFFTSIDDAAAFAVGASQRGFDAYHACAVFREPGSRKAANALGAKAFWLDVDVGEGKPYATNRDALAAIFTFCGQASLPIPMVVGSGGGWHVYWGLEHALDPRTWKIQADALKAACSKYGLHADAVRTADIASILRPVGTSNYKRSPSTRVEMRHVVEPISPAAFQFSVPRVVDNSKFEVKVTAQEEPSYARIVAENCGQMARLRDTRGNIPEPEWYAGLCVLGRCADGARLVQEWSSGHPDYDGRETERKFDHAGRDSGPTTCKKFQDLNPVPCTGCPYSGRITSPIQLGHAHAGEVGDTQPAAIDGGQYPAGMPLQDGDVTYPALPSGFRWNGSRAIEYRDTTEEGVVEWYALYKAPLFLDTIRKNELTKTINVVMKHWLPKEGWQEAMLPWHDRSQKTVINALASQGVNVDRTAERTILRYIDAWIDDFQSKRTVEMEYAQFGWRNDYTEFLLGDELYRVGTPRPKIVGVTPELKTRGDYLKAVGSYENWRRAVQPLFAHEQQGLAVVAGFASTLMRFVNENASAVLLAVSTESRLGKSMGLIAARSIWGDDKALDISINESIAARFRIVATMNGLPVTWDDMRHKNDPEILKQFIHSFSQGRDKNRLSRDGELRASLDGWATIMLATSNVSISEIIGHDGETAQQARVLEYRFTKMDGTRYADGMEWERQMRANRGTAGRRWVQTLMQPGVIEYIQATIPIVVARLEKDLQKSEASFYASMLAAIVVTSEILNRYDMLEFSIPRLMKFAIDKTKEAVAAITENAMTPPAVFTRLYNDSLWNTLVVKDKWVARTATTIEAEPRAKLSIRYEQIPAKIFLDRNFVRSWCRENNIMFHDLQKRLLDGKILLSSGRRIVLGAGTPFSGGGQSLCWEIDASHPDLGGLRLLPERLDDKVRPLRPAHPPATAEVS